MLPSCSKCDSKATFRLSLTDKIMCAECGYTMVHKETKAQSLGTNRALSADRPTKHLRDRENVMAKADVRKNLSTDTYEFTSRDKKKPPPERG